MGAERGRERERRKQLQAEGRARANVKRESRALVCSGPEGLECTEWLTLLCLLLSVAALVRVCASALT